MNSNSTLRLAAIFGFTGVALGAFGAHALRATLTANETTEVWKTAVLYHLIHAAVLAAIGLSGAGRRCAVWCFGCGITVFSGSLYVLALTNIKVLGAITPFGGVGLLVGWVLLGFGRSEKS